MAQLTELKSISEEKRLLRAQCELCRRSLDLQLASMRADAAWFRHGVDSVARYRSLFWLAVPVAGFLVARRGRMLRRFLLRGVAAWQLLSRLWRWTSPLRRPH